MSERDHECEWRDCHAERVDGEAFYCGEHRCRATIKQDGQTLRCTLPDGHWLDEHMYPAPGPS